MEENKKEEQVKTKPVEKVIDYIDDRGQRHRMYTSNQEVESYIKRNYDIIEDNPQENLTS